MLELDWEEEPEPDFRLAKRLVRALAEVPAAWQSLAVWRKVSVRPGELSESSTQGASDESWEVREMEEAVGVHVPALLFVRGAAASA